MSHRNGYTIIELLVVITITSAVAYPLTTFAISGLQSYGRLEAQSNASIDINILAGRLSKVIRGATTIDTAGSNSLIFYGYFSPQDSVIKRIRYFVSGTSLKVGLTPPTGTAPNYTYDTSTEVVTTLRTDLAMNSTPMFTYYDDADNALSGSFVPGQVKEVGLYLAINPNTKLLGTPISLNTKITLRNQKVNL